MRNYIAHKWAEWDDEKWQAKNSSNVGLQDNLADLASLAHLTNLTNLQTL
jgi:hypothetical protein